MIGIGTVATTSIILLFVAFWGLVIFSVVTLLRRLLEISRSLRSIEAKLSGNDQPESHPKGES